MPLNQYAHDAPGLVILPGTSLRPRGGLHKSGTRDCTRFRLQSRVLSYGRYALRDGASVYKDAPYSGAGPERRDAQWRLRDGHQ